MEFLQSLLVWFAVAMFGGIGFHKGRRLRYLMPLIIAFIALGAIEQYRLKTEPEYAAQRAAQEAAYKRERKERAVAARLEKVKFVQSLAERSPTAPPSKVVLARLTDRYTESQRQDWFDANVDGKIISWPVVVRDVQRGIFGGVTVIGSLTARDEVWCDMHEDYEDAARALTKTSRVICVGEVYGYAKFLGVTIYAKNAAIK